MSKTTHSIHLHQDRPQDSNRWVVERHSLESERDLLTVASRTGASEYDGLEFDIFGSKEECDQQLVELIRISVDTLIETAGPEAWVRLSMIIDKTCPDCGAELSDGSPCTVCASQAERCSECGTELDDNGVCPPCYEQQLEDADTNHRLALVKEQA